MKWTPSFPKLSFLTLLKQVMSNPQKQAQEPKPAIARLLARSQDTVGFMRASLKACDTDLLWKDSFPSDFLMSTFRLWAQRLPENQEVSRKALEDINIDQYIYIKQVLDTMFENPSRFQRTDTNFASVAFCDARWVLLRQLPWLP